MAHALATILLTSGYILPAPVPAWAQTVVPNVDMHVDSPRPVELVGHPEGSTGWASICQSPCDVPVPLTWTYGVQDADKTVSPTFRLKPTSEDARVVIRPASPSVTAGGITLAILGGLAVPVGYVLTQVANERQACPGALPPGPTGANGVDGCNAAPHEGDALPGALLITTGVLALVVGAIMIIDGSTMHASQVQ